MLSLVRRAFSAHCHLASSPLRQLRSYSKRVRGGGGVGNQALVTYEIRLDFSWVRRDAATGRPIPPSYLTDASKSPDQVLAGLSDFDRRRLRDIRDQIDIQAALGKPRVPDPDRISSFDWILLLGCVSARALGSRFHYLATKQLSETNDLEKRAARRAQLAAEAESAKLAPPPQTWDRILSRVEAPELKAFYNLRLLQEYEYCPSLVLDMAFHDRMPVRGLFDFARQLLEIFHYNRSAVEPFQLHFCNLRRDTQQYYHLHKALGDHPKDSTGEPPRSIEEIWPYQFTEACYTSLFPASDLVYLSPDGGQELRVYDPAKVYIIGGLVDLSGNEVGLTKSKAAGQGIRCCRLPRAVTPRSLPLNIFFQMLHDLRVTGSWQEAKHRLPKRHSYTPVSGAARLLTARQ